MAYMRDQTGRRLDGFQVAGADDGIGPIPGQLAAEYVSTSGSNRPGWMSPTTGYIYNHSAAQVRRSNDGFSFSAIGAAFARQTTLVLETSDGELLVCLNPGGGGSTPADPPPEVWRSSGYAAGANLSPTFTLVLTGSDGGVRFDRRWSSCVHEEHVFLSEYGWKSADSAVKKVYHSADHGATWRIIFTHPSASLAEAHIHAVAYDRWWDRVWVTVGDGTANRAIYYSDDWTEATPTWVTATRGGPNVVGVFPMAECILFGTDDPINGVKRYTREGYRRHAPVGQPESVHAINSSGVLTHVAGTMWRRSDADPVLIPFSPSVTPAPPSVLVATMNGRDFYTVWTDPQGNYAAGYAKGLFTMFGPTNAGKLIGELRDDRYSYTLLRADAPDWHVSPSVHGPDGSSSRLMLSGGDLALVDAEGNETSVGGAVSSVDGLTGAVTLSDRYATRPAGLYLPGTSGNYVSAVDTPALSPAGDIDIRVKVALTNWNPGSGQGLCSKWAAAGTYCWNFYVANTGHLAFNFSADGTSAVSTNSAAAPAVANGSGLWVRATLDIDDGSGSSIVTFYTSTDGETWTQLGAPVTRAAAASLFDSPSAVELGGRNSGASDRAAGVFHEARILSGIGGALAGAWSAALPVQRQRDAAGNVWAVNGTGHAWVAP